MSWFSSKMKRWFGIEERNLIKGVDKVLISLAEDMAMASAMKALEPQLGSNLTKTIVKRIKDKEKGTPSDNEILEFLVVEVIKNLPKK
mgnify:FL=1|jgi:hypothetical protein